MLTNLSVDFKKMVELLLKQKPEISAEQIREMIDEKKRKVGAGYLTDQGALFLVAADLGVSFDSLPKAQSGLKDIYVGAKEVTVKVKLWDRHVAIPDEMGLQVGDVIKIIKGYVRAGLDGKPVINLGSY